MNEPTCPKCGSKKVIIDDVGDGCDFSVQCLDCKFYKVYDGIDS